MSASDRRKEKQIRERVIRRDGLVCCYCQCNLQADQAFLTLDHVIPVSKHGVFGYTNLTVACSTCNQKRGNRNFFEFAAEYHFPLDKSDRYLRLFKATSELKLLSLMLKNYSETSKVPQELASTAHRQLLKNFPAYHPTDLDAALKRWKQICRTLHFSFKKPSTKQALKKAITHLTQAIEGE
jgi:hypothetical protein